MSTIYDWFKEGFTLIPNHLFSEYAQLKLNSNEFVLISYLLSKATQGESTDELEDATIQLGWTKQKLMEVINSLMNKKYLLLELKPDMNGRQTDHYSLRPLFEFLDSNYFAKKDLASSNNSNYHGQDLVLDFETEFGRPLSPIELEKISAWINKDGFNHELIKIALREAVIHQALSFNYIDRILLNWQKKNIRTVLQAEKEIFNFQERTQPDAKEGNAIPEVKIPIINDWGKG